MSKRNRFIEVSPESIALKLLREKCDLSLRELAQLMGISYSRVHQMEKGRDNVTETYVKEFLLATSKTWEEWNNSLGQPDRFYELRQKCCHLIKNIEPNKLEIVYGVLSNL